MTDEQLDQEHDILFSPQPAVFVRSVANDANYVKCPRITTRFCSTTINCVTDAVWRS